MATTKENKSNNNSYDIMSATMPNSVEAERHLLCSIMRDVNMQLEIISQLNRDDFYQDGHKYIFDAMNEITISNNTVNYTTVIDALRRNGKLAQVGDIDYILSIWDLLPSTVKFGEYLDIVKRASVMRHIIEICGDVTKRAYAYQSTEEVIAYAEEKLFALSQKGTNGGLISFVPIATKTLADIQSRYLNPGQFQGTKTGFPTLDKLTNGLHGGELIIIAARPGIGKSALAMNIVENIASQGKTVAVFSLEMGTQQLIERMFAGMGNVPLSEIKSGNLSYGEADLQKLKDAYARLVATMKLYGNDTANIRPAEIRSQCRRLKQQSALDLVVIDYIGLMKGDSADGDRSENRQSEVASITRGLKIMAKELNVPVIALSQLKREAESRNINGKGGEKGSIEPVLSDLRESGAIEQDADIVMFIHREYKDNAEDNVQLIVAKHRNGETQNIPLRWNGPKVKFTDMNQPIEAPQPVTGKEVKDEGFMIADNAQDGQFSADESVIDFGKE